jgi:hypothetical protein
MALTKGVNSYGTVIEADAHFADRLDVAAWDVASETDKGKALVTATSVFEELPWSGVIASESQDLAHPRIGTYFDPRKGFKVNQDGSVVSSRIIAGSFELAHHLLENDGLLDDTGSLQSLKVGPIAMDFIFSPSKIPAIVRNIIKPLLVNQGTRNWHRSN